MKGGYNEVSQERIDEVRDCLKRHDYDIAAAAAELGKAYCTVERYDREIRRRNKEETLAQRKKILLFDIETAPMRAFAWSMWKNNIGKGQLISDWFMLCYAAKWLGGDDVYLASQRNDPDYYPGTEDDHSVCLTLHALLDEADIVVAHNGAKFDVKKANARFLKHGLQPPSPYKILDTLTIAKRHFKISSNRLDFIGKFLGVGQKMEHQGFELWSGCLAGDQDCWSTMESYNVQDVLLLEQVYEKLAPWDNRHPTVNTDHSVSRCTVCGSKELEADGEVYTAVSTFTAYQCRDCGHWVRNGSNKKNKEEMSVTMRNAL